MLPQLESRHHSCAGYPLAYCLPFLPPRKPRESNKLAVREAAKICPAPLQVDLLTLKVCPSLV